jgi:RNA polymerase subunit RPABC4/transcription elongation factor Spt4
MAEQIDATVAADSPLALKLGAGMTTQDNQRGINWSIDANLMRPVEYHIFMFNVGVKSHEIRKPPLFPYVLVPGVGPGERYHLAFKIPNICNQGWADPDNGSIRHHGDDGRRVAMDMINPLNPGIDQDWQIDSKSLARATSIGDDLSQWGLFWSLNETPTEVEIGKAIARMEKFYRRLIAEANGIVQSGRYDRQGQDRLNEHHFLAADHFGYKSSWNTLVETPAGCPNCGEPIKAGIAYHKNSMDMVCIIDPERARKAGLKVPVIDEPEESPKPKTRSVK